MNIVERKFIYKPELNLEWAESHAQVPFAYTLNNKVRIFFATRDSLSRSSITFIDVEREDPSNIIYIHDKPVFQKNSPGTFDDSGTMPSWFLNHEGKLWMYYTGWNKSETASYRLSIGLAISSDEGRSFSRMFEGPILDRDKYDPIWVGQPCVIKVSEKDWRMWYLSCQKIELINGHPEPFYNVKYATSSDGIDWNREEEICIDFDEKTDAIGRPCVWYDNGLFKMFHSNRKAAGYRTDKKKSYRIEYSESTNGISWKSKKEKVTINKSSGGWDSIMNEYCSVYHHKKNLFVLYNGNGFGASGFGYLKFRD